MEKLYQLDFVYVDNLKGNPIFKITSDNLPNGLTNVIQKFAKLYQIEIV